MIVYVIIALVIIGLISCCVKKYRNSDEINNNEQENLPLPNPRNPFTRYYINPLNININRNVNSLNDISNNNLQEDTFIQKAIENSKITYNNEINNNLQNIPKIKLKEYIENNKDNCSITIDDENNYLCCICYEIINENDEIYLIPCKHVLHKKCLNDIAFEKALCPFCREKLFV